MRAGAASNIGEIHMEFGQPNQDNFIVDTEKRLFAVFDGHGEQGHVIADYLKKNIPSTFGHSRSLSPLPSIEDSLKTSFATLDQNICKEKTSESSGSTCVLVFLENSSLYVAGVGDCTALLVKANPSGDNIESKSLVTSHKITNETEHERILKTGAAITSDYVVSKEDPNKVINMTRAFGDQDMKSSGIISIPEITVTQLTSHDESERAPKKLKMSMEVTEKSENTEKTENAQKAEKTEKSENSEKKDEGTSSSEQTDVFLVLFSDGLEQVQSVDTITKKAHQLLRKNLSNKSDEKAEQVSINTVCSVLLKELEKVVEEREDVGFSDDATVVLVLLSGF